MKAVLPSRFSPSDTAPAGPAALTCRPVRDAGELATHHLIRRAVFVDEQGLFTGDDRDAHDDAPDTLHVIGQVDGAAAGTVRLYPLDRAGLLWKGDRLAVLPRQRRSGIGGPLVRLAVALAEARGGEAMVATVQAVNTGFFLELGWSCDGQVVDHLGVPHQPMSISLR